MHFIKGPKITYVGFFLQIESHAKMRLSIGWYRGPGRHLELTWRWSGPEFDNIQCGYMNIWSIIMWLHFSFNTMSYSKRASLSFTEWGWLDISIMEHTAECKFAVNGDTWIWSEWSSNVGMYVRASCGQDGGMVVARNDMAQVSNRKV